MKVRTVVAKPALSCGAAGEVKVLALRLMGTFPIPHIHRAHQNSVAYIVRLAYAYRKKWGDPNNDRVS